ncbi:MAG TPA: PepSY-associated TM helix domain-containing protein [Rhodanobacteraceae bacterium]|nr:PepSY-associated TM helix domain-containing protein [Rhodanobacteraceae bacterium]
MSATRPLQRDQARRGYWLRHLHRWHWISAALSLAGLLLFALTGFTLNHAGAIEASPTVLHREASVPAALRAQLSVTSAGKDVLPKSLRDWLGQALAVPIPARAAEWSSDEVYLSMPRPGGDAWLSIDRETGAVEYERTDRGWIAYLNDLHKGRNAGALWSWFIDLFALACVVFALTGLILLKLHAANRRSTWPLLGLGVLLPLLLALLFIH